MKNDKDPMKPVAWLRWLVATVLAAGALCPPQALAQDPPRTYWKYLSDGNATPLLFQTISGNSNPFDPAHLVTPDATFDATMAIMAYAHTFSLFDRAAVGTIMLPMGRLSGGVSGSPVKESASGFGDPMLELNVNVLGPPAQKTIPDMNRYEPGFSVDAVFDLALPVGEYDNSKPLNIGQNRWYGRAGAPVVWQLGPWVPGRRTTLEFVPAVWLFGDNKDYSGGNTLKTDPMYQFDAHLTRDLYERAWASLDAYSLTGGRSSINGIAGKKLDNKSLGLTLGFQINDNMNLSFSYKSTIRDKAPDDLHMDMFMVTLVVGWHPILEGSRRLQGEK
jgi:hypothetical protein